MIALKHRFHGHNSLRPLYQKGQSAYSRNLKMLWLPIHTDSYRVAVVVSKKVHKSAVVRNRIRRRIYGVVQTFFASQNASCDIIFLAQNPALADLPAHEVQAEVAGLLKKVPITD